jgi:hypothetical protein
MFELLFNSNPGWDLVKAIFNYYGLKDYATIRYLENLNPKKIRKIQAYDFKNIPGDGSFWHRVMSGDIIKGDYLQLENFQISPWFPRKPGQYWTYEAAKARKDAFDRHIEHKDQGWVIFDIYGKNLMTEVGGIGTVNFRKDREFVLATATSSGITHEGIPVLFRKNTWEEIESTFKQERRIEVDLQGQIVEIPTEFNSFLLRTANVPKVALLVNSLLNVKMKVTRLDVKITPWTIFERNSHESPYAFTYVTHNLFSDEKDNSTVRIKKYVESHDGKTILTDFDEELNSLNSIFPLNDCMSGQIMGRDVLTFCQNLMNKYT